MNASHDANWIVTNERADAATLDQFAAVCCISNGYLGLSGRLCEQRGGRSPMTIINGVYDEIDQFGTLGPYRPDQRYLDPEQMKQPRKSPAIANLPDPLAIRVFIDGVELIFDPGSVAHFRQTLNLRTGLYTYEIELTDAQGRATRVEMQRFACLEHAHRVFMRYRVTPLNQAARLTLLSGFDAATLSNSTREAQYEIRRRESRSAEQLRLHVVTPARRHDVRLAVTQRVIGAAPSAPPVVREVEHGIFTEYAFDAAPRQGVTLERSIVVTCSEDARHHIVVDFEKECASAATQSFDMALTGQAANWSKLWERADVRIAGDDRAQLYLRFCIHHLLAAAPRFTDRLSVPVKLLSGEYYQGNTFYDTELYILPFYIHAAPEYARTCLHYRYQGLVAARAAARALGCLGAKFSWQSGPYGEECLGPWYRFVHTNIHINADVAYALMEYRRATGDKEFLRECGLDMLAESARFYLTRAVANPSCGLSLVDVAGPDEGHCKSTDNFYTNYLARKTLAWAAEEFDRLRHEDSDQYERAVRRLRLEQDEPERWREAAAALRLLQDPATKVYEQCEGFFQLPPPPADLLENRKEWFTTVYSYQALNQPDVLLALTLFPNGFDEDTWRANWQYYRKLSMNFSSMSFAVNALAALRMNELDEAYEQFLIAAGMDLDPSLTGRNDTFQGLHGTAMGGAWQVVIQGFAGVRLTERGLRIEPRLPAGWRELSFRIALQGAWIEIRISATKVHLKTVHGQCAGLRLLVANREFLIPEEGEIELPRA